MNPHPPTSLLTMSPAPRNRWARATSVAICAVALTVSLVAVPQPALADDGPRSCPATRPALVDLPVLPGGLWSEPRALNDHDIAVGVANPGLDYDLTHAVRWTRSGSISDLGTLPGDTASSANDLNDQSVVVGTSESVMAGGTRSRAVRWDQNGRIRALAPVAGATSTSAAAINRRGTAIGSASFPTETRAVRWTATGNARLLPVGSAGSPSVAHAINDDDVVVGTVAGKPVLWDSRGRLHHLGTLPGRPAGAATALNDRGEIVGFLTTADPAGNAHAVRWDRHGGPTDLGTLDNGSGSRATAINDHGLVIGQSGTPDRPFAQAVRWDRAGHISKLPGDSVPSVAAALNRTGQVVGYAITIYPGYSPMLWTCNQRIELPALTGGDEGGLAIDINERGTILGVNSAPPEYNHAVLWRR